MAVLRVGTEPCTCSLERHEPKRIVLTGGPGAGKTAVLEMASRIFCKHVGILPEAASIVFGGGFPRHQSEAGRRAAQRAIYHVQREIEELVLEERRVGVALCDRGTIDGLAYWPAAPDLYWEQIGTTLDAELARYAAVIHLETPTAEEGYNHQNALRIESASDARAIDQRIVWVWSTHPRYFTVPSTPSFTEKAVRALEIVRDELPACCRHHELPLKGGQLGRKTP